MKKIYVVTEGDYSDYHICGVFDDKILAEKFIESFQNPYELMEVEEWQLNPYKKELKEGYKPYFVRIAKNGTIQNIKTEKSPSGFDNDENFGFDVDNNLYLHIYAKDEKHAIKIANKKRISFIVNDEWGKSK